MEPTVSAETTTPTEATKATEATGCQHGMDPSWCYLCRIDNSGVDAHTAWGLDDDDAPTIDSFEAFIDPMSTTQARYVAFLCGEFGVTFDPTLNEGEGAVIVISFLDEPMTASQTQTLEWLVEHGGGAVDAHLTYGEARARIRRLVALRGLKSSSPAIATRRPSG